MVKVAQRAEEVLGRAHLVTNNDSPLPRTFDLVEFEDRAKTTALEDVVHDRLVNFEGIFRRFLEEERIRYSADIDLFRGGILLEWIRGNGREVALRDKVAAQRLRVSSRHASRAVGFKAEGLLRR